MQDKMECDWFKPSTNPTKSRNKNNCVSTLESKMREIHNGMHSKLKQSQTQT